MSWYFFGGFSAKAMVPSTRWVNHSGCLFTQGWSGEHWRAKSIATSRCRAVASATKWSKSSSVPRSGWIASWPPSGEPIAHGEPTSCRPAVRVLSGPLRKARPIGCTGGRYTTSKPIAATAGSRSAAVRRVPERGGSTPDGSTTAPSERGKNSYQEPNSARSRSTWSGSGRVELTSSRSG